ncbi:MAG: cold shock domain-containing protein [Gemmatimonadetes bacterium]|nr:cold shock domain-containing protein [Gemmatimonadota bacterium]
MPQGTISRLNQTRGYGFINTPENEDLFFHRSNIKNAQFSLLQVGERVTYTVQFTSRGPRADQVQVQNQSTKLQVNLAVKDLRVSAAFYTETFDFKERTSNPGYILLQRNALVLGLKTDELLWYPDPGEQPVEALARGVGVELVLETSDIDQFHARMQQAGATIHEPLKEQPWGARDFRMLDPDGYYWRITSPRDQDPVHPAHPEEEPVEGEPA